MYSSHSVRHTESFIIDDWTNLGRGLLFPTLYPKVLLIPYKFPKMNEIEFMVYISINYSVNLEQIVNKLTS